MHVSGKWAGIGGISFGVIFTACASLKGYWETHKVNPNDWLVGFVAFFQPDGIAWGIFNLIILLAAVVLIIIWLFKESKSVITWLKLVRVRSPFYLKDNTAVLRLSETPLNVLPSTDSKPATVKKKEPVRLKHDSVLWEDTGYYMNGKMDVRILCYHDLAGLMIKHGDKIENIKYDKVISNNDYKLYCPECKREILLSGKPKAIQVSYEEACNRLEGLKRRKQS